MSKPSPPPDLPVPDAEVSERSLVQAVVEVARLVFGAAAASVFLLDPVTGELVFEAVAGEGEDRLRGTRLPAGTGIAGWVAASGQPLLIENVSESPMFALSAAESTGYVPISIMAAPLIREGSTVGVIEVLDHGTQPRDELRQIDLLGILALKLTIDLDLLARLRWMQRREIAPADGGRATANLALLRRLAERLPGADAPVATAVASLLLTADNMLAASADADRS
jgi:GAF domain-containing protein